MRFKLDIVCENAAFDPPGPEIARLLKEAAEAVDNGASSGVLRDINGNRVGKFSLT